MRDGVLSCGLVLSKQLTNKKNDNTQIIQTFIRCTQNPRPIPSYLKLSLYVRTKTRSLWASMASLLLSKPSRFAATFSTPKCPPPSFDQQISEIPKLKAPTCSPTPQTQTIRILSQGGWEVGRDAWMADGGGGDVCELVFLFVGVRKGVKTKSERIKVERGTGRVRKFVEKENKDDTQISLLGPPRISCIHPPFY